ncbi:DUF3073 domain-containing protein [Corynebacterium sp.]|uniref:DUF3073 domain-containing protein n=1 Tax=Corynebacterium sp. TaxID=1720 RepID=UPI0026DD3E58|nr:DUF3073 domain-containing protein [Corynebacterium sp.]MDO5076970.1 DUF3073 domain-containing protein [Corynebacterium sp.]
MGRGRAKAKQAKVARQLKYNSPEMDLASLQRELAGKSENNSSRREDDQYAEWADWEADDDDDERSWR